MVFEQLIKERWLLQKEHAFFLGLFYSILGFVSAKFIFPANLGLMSAAFTSILLIPSLGMLLKLEENIEIRENKLSIVQLFNDHKDIFKVYIFLFLGIFLAYSLISLIFPEETIKIIFSTQLRSAGIHGLAFSDTLLLGLIANNLIVFAVSFLLSLIYGAGAILFLTWNASVWGVAFAFFSKQVSYMEGSNPFVAFGAQILPFLPHMVTEALAYISAAIVGGVVSKAILREDIHSKKFKHIITDALIFLALGLILVLIAGIIEVKVFAAL